MHHAQVTRMGGNRRSASAVRWRTGAFGTLLFLGGFGLGARQRPAATTTPEQPDVHSLALELNIPAYRLDVRADGELVRSYTVAVGMRAYKTPVGEFEISQIVWNPWWHPPDAEWAANDTVTPPGPRNPMGKVKLLLNGPYYLHGSPTVSSLGHAASHGCVRLRNEDAVELARLVQDNAGTEPSLTGVGGAALLDSIMSTWTKTRTFKLERFIPVSIVYRTAEVRDTLFTLYPDVYRRQREGSYAVAMSTLHAEGIDTAAVNTQLVRRLARRAAREIVSVPIQQLFGTIAVGGQKP